MKNLNLLLIIIASLLLSGCSKDEDPPQPTQVIVTQPTPCPTGYTGANCATQITPTKIRINKISVTKFPQYDGSVAWDISDIGDSRPEIYINFGMGSTVFFTTGYFQDANYFMTYDYTGSYLPYDILLPTSVYSIELKDYDNGTDDFIGGYTFTPYNSANGFPDVIVIGAAYPVTFELHVSYIF